MRYVSLVLFISLIFGVNFNFKAQECEVIMTLYRANMKPLANKLVTFKSEDENHSIDIITMENGFCRVSLRQNTQYHILYQDIVYEDLFKIPRSNFLECTGPLVIDGGLFTTVKMKVYDSGGDYSLLKNETIICESKSTGKLYEEKTNENGLVEFYLPRNASYDFHSVFEKYIQNIEIGDGGGISIYRISLNASTIPEKQYQQRISLAEQEELEWIKQIELEDSLKGTIPINVLLFINAEMESGDEKCPHLGKIYIYKSKGKNIMYGSVDGNWSIGGLCENGLSLCLNSVKNNDGSYSKAVLPLKLKRGNHKFYIEDEKGFIKREVNIEVEIRKSYNYLKNNSENFYLTSPICIQY